MRAFQPLVGYRGLQPLVGLFFQIFIVVRPTKDISARCGLVRFLQKGRLFSLFSSSVRGFKTKYLPRESQGRGRL